MSLLLRLLLVALVIGIGGVTALGVLDQPQREAPPGFKGRYVDVQGIRTRYLQAGEGTDVLLIHGSPGSIEDWQPLFDALSAKYRVTAYDRPGHGYSGPTDGWSDYQRHAAFAHALVDELGLQHVAVVGHSFGGTTALAMALQDPADLRSLVVIDSATYRWARRGDPAYRLLVIPGFGNGLARLVSGSVTPQKIRDGLADQYAPAPMPDGFAEARIPIWSQPKVMVSAAREALGAPGDLGEISPRYREIQRPVFVIAQGDHPLRRENAERLQRDVAGSQLTLVEKAGHFIHHTKTAEVLGLIDQAAAIPH